ncbi:retropepsin-like aspartic protease [Sphingomonas sp. UYAg733]
MTIALLTAGATPIADQASRPQPEATPAPVLTFGAANNGRMTVPVQIGGQGPFEFVIDTGAERSVVSRELAASLKLPRGRPVRIFGFGGVAAVDTVVVPALSVSTLGTTTMEAPALASSNLGARGMLGIDALKGHRISIDFNRKQMTLTPSNKRRLGGRIVVHANDYAGQLIVTDATYAGKPISVIVDTGSPVTVGNSAMMRLTKTRLRPIGPISVISVTGQSFDANYVTTDGLNIGGVRFDNVPLAFADAPPFDRFGLRDKPALILGMSSLKLFRRVEIDFANREILFTLPSPPLLRSACRAWLNCNTYGAR